ncbi:futalosine hydrolase [Micromonospora pattaloongensis]|uniref:Futalosine hydrolase n=1 Tax=Micromonospora pattaloongensis TaxID=405436 RepID=A0A1H3SNE3_9ACTN|nr:futalosine hydrolase [Micromonospora pattaloongensis]SDZ38649.1 futalosine hydrolase [Micromonospora pattaloongensis]
MSGLLLVTAVEAEADALRAGLTTDAVTVAAVGVGPAAVAAGTARLLALAEAEGRRYDAVISAGIGGGFTPRAPVGATVLATSSIAADLGADSPAGFLSLDELGFGRIAVPVDAGLLDTLRAALPHAVVGAVLTVSTVTGTAERERALAERHPDAVAEAMEGYGVACAAAGAGLPFAELRTISNPIGPRDRGAWRIRDAFTALTAAAAALG